MKKAKKILTLALCAALLVCISVGATVAYLTAKTGEVKNTFTVGKVSLDNPDTDLDSGLTEAKTDKYGVPINANGEETTIDKAPRVTSNEYKLVPGHTYTKDPTVHVVKDSEECYVFVKVENGIEDLEADTDGEYNCIEDQIINVYKWTKLGSETNVYYKLLTTDSADGLLEAQDLTVFGEFKLKDDAAVDKLTINEKGYYVKDNEIVDITIQAHAIQADGFENDVDAAWAAFNTQNK